ncbi:hypothetical protein, partial [Salmonella enterica]|uniref:hypothetical protein n=1 Tax=Salmonella enterica TaxID=28901 RepID=UPI003D7C15D6
MRPDILLGSEEMGPPPVLQQLRAAGVRIETLSAKADEKTVHDTIQRLGALLGAPDTAEQGEAAVADAQAASAQDDACGLHGDDPGGEEQQVERDFFGRHEAHPGRVDKGPEYSRAVLLQARYTPPFPGASGVISVVPARPASPCEGGGGRC